MKKRKRSQRQASFRDSCSGRVVRRIRGIIIKRKKGNMMRERMREEEDKSGQDLFDKIDNILRFIGRTVIRL